MYNVLRYPMITTEALNRVLQGSSLSTFGTARVLHHPPVSDSLPPTRESILAKLNPDTAVQDCQDVQTSVGRPMVISSNAPAHCANPTAGITEYVQINTSAARVQSLIDARAWRRTQTMLPKTKKETTSGRVLNVKDKRMNRSYETDIVGLGGAGPVLLPNGIKLDRLAGRTVPRKRLPLDLQPAPNPETVEHQTIQCSH